MTSQSLTCPACGFANPLTANFCPNCGRRLDGEAEPVAYTHSPTRLFGVLSPVATFVLGCLVLLAAIAAFAAASPILGVLLLAIAAAVFVLFYGAAERDPSSTVARGALTAKDRIQGWTSFTAGAAGAWARAGRDLLRLRGELRALRDERERAQLALGDAAYREDESAVASLRERMHELDAEITSREHARTASLARARDQAEDEHLAVRHTQVLTPEETEQARGTADS